MDEFCRKWNPKESLTSPLRWRKTAVARIDGDLFHESVPDEWIDMLFAVMALCPQHTFQVLTKRSARMRDYLETMERCFHGAVDTYRDRWGAAAIEVSYSSCAAGTIEEINFPIPNIWLGVSAEDQQRADERIPDLLATPAAVRWVSLEPLLGSIDLSPFIRARDRSIREWNDFAWPSWVPEKTRSEIMGFWRKEWGRGPSDWLHCSIQNGHPSLGTRGSFPLLRKGEPLVSGRFIHAWNNIGRVVDDAGTVHCVSAGRWQVPNPYLDWVVTGGESGPEARVTPYGAFSSIQKQCAAAAVAYFHKQNGEHVWSAGEAIRVGKKRAGRLLEGRTWDEMPRTA